MDECGALGRYNNWKQQKHWKSGSDLKIDIVIIQNTLCTKRELKLLHTQYTCAATCESVYNGLMSIELLHEIVPIGSI